MENFLPKVKGQKLSVRDDYNKSDSILLVNELEDNDIRNVYAQSCEDLEKYYSTIGTSSFATNGDWYDVGEDSETSNFILNPSDGASGIVNKIPKEIKDGLVVRFYSPLDCTSGSNSDVNLETVNFTDSGHYSEEVDYQPFRLSSNQYDIWASEQGTYTTTEPQSPSYIEFEYNGLPFNLFSILFVESVGFGGRPKKVAISTWNDNISNGTQIYELVFINNNATLQINQNAFITTKIRVTIIEIDNVDVDNTNTAINEIVIYGNENVNPQIFYNNISSSSSLGTNDGFSYLDFPRTNLGTSNYWYSDVFDSDGLELFLYNSSGSIDEIKFEIDANQFLIPNSVIVYNDNVLIDTIDIIWDGVNGSIPLGTSSNYPLLRIVLQNFTMNGGINQTMNFGCKNLSLLENNISKQQDTYNFYCDSQYMYAGWQSNIENLTSSNSNSVWVSRLNSFDDNSGVANNGYESIVFQQPNGYLTCNNLRLYYLTTNDEMYFPFESSYANSIELLLYYSDSSYDIHTYSGNESSAILDFDFPLNSYYKIEIRIYSIYASYTNKTRTIGFYRASLNTNNQELIFNWLPNLTSNATVNGNYTYLSSASSSLETTIEYGADRLKNRTFPFISAQNTVQGTSVIDTNILLSFDETKQIIGINLFFGDTILTKVRIDGAIGDNTKYSFERELINNNGNSFVDFGTYSDERIDNITITILECANSIRLNSCDLQTLTINEKNGEDFKVSLIDEETQHLNYKVVLNDGSSLITKSISKGDIVELTYDETRSSFVLITTNSKKDFFVSSGVKEVTYHNGLYAIEYHDLTPYFPRSETFDIGDKVRVKFDVQTNKSQYIRVFGEVEPILDQNYDILSNNKFIGIVELTKVNYGDGYAFSTPSYSSISLEKFNFSRKVGVHNRYVTIYTDDVPITFDIANRKYVDDVSYVFGQVSHSTLDNEVIESTFNYDYYSPSITYLNTKGKLYNVTLRQNEDVENVYIEYSSSINEENTMRGCEYYFSNIEGTYQNYLLAGSRCSHSVSGSGTYRTFFNAKKTFDFNNGELKVINLKTEFSSVCGSLSRSAGFYADLQMLGNLILYPNGQISYDYSKDNFVFVRNCTTGIYDNLNYNWQSSDLFTTYSQDMDDYVEFSNNKFEFYHYVLNGSNMQLFHIIFESEIIDGKTRLTITYVINSVSSATNYSHINAHSLDKDFLKINK